MTNGTPYANGADLTSLFSFSGGYPSAPDVFVAPATGGSGQSLVMSFTSVPEPAVFGLLTAFAMSVLRPRGR